MGKTPGLTLQASIVQDNIPVEVSPRIYVGSTHAAFNMEALFERNITHILNLAGNYATFPGSFTYLSVSIRDKEYANLLSCLPVALLFVEAALAGENNGVFVHCAGGRSRSPAVIIAYLMVKHQLGYDEALARILTVRPVVSLNGGFEAQLRCLGKMNGDVFAAHQLALKTRLTDHTLQENVVFVNTKAIAEERRSRKVDDRSDSFLPPYTPRAKYPHCDYDGTHSAVYSACDERGMICSQIPCGFSLSIAQPGTAVQYFIPALQSMGTLYGCRACGECLFPASAIVAPCVSKQKPVSCTESDRTDKTRSVDRSKATRPVLSKLSLKPQSPLTGSSEGKVMKLKQTSREHVTSRDTRTSDMCTTGLPSFKCRELPDTFVKETINDSQASSSKFWRSLARFRSSSMKNAKAGKREVTHMVKKLPTQGKGINLSEGDSDSLAVANSNSRTSNKSWEDKFRQLDQCWTRESASECIETTRVNDRFAAQLKSIIAKDNLTLSLLESSEAWIVEPQEWIHNLELSESRGNILCPNERCRMVVGRWRLPGSVSTCNCGHVVAPACQVDRTAVQILGNVLTLPNHAEGLRKRGVRE